MNIEWRINLVLFFVCFLSKAVINYKIYSKNNWFLNNELLLVDLIIYNT